jgi:acetoin:2,6-dichlorophenolindophenol oxidoreductase subunit beta
VELGQAAVVREGSDVTLVGLAATVPLALAAAERLADEGFQLLDAPIKRVAAACVPLPFAGALEDLVIPTTDSVAETVRKLAAY